MADKDNIEAWITVKGNHIPILKGQSKEEAVKAFLANLLEYIDKLYGDPNKTKDLTRWLSPSSYYVRPILQNMVERFMNHDDFENENSFKKGVARAVKEMKMVKDQYKTLKPQITVGFIPPTTKSHLFITGLNHKGYLKDQTPEIKASVQRLTDALPKKHKEYYEYAGNKYVLQWTGKRVNAAFYDEKNNVLSSATVTRELEEKLTDLIAKDKIKPAGVANIRPLVVSNYTSFDTIMSAVADTMGSYKYAEKKLAEYGIYGLKYKGEQDDECIVMYDPAMFSVVARTLEQKLKDKIAQIESLKPGESLPIEENTTSDEKDTE